MRGVLLADRGAVSPCPLPHAGAAPALAEPEASVENTDVSGTFLFPASTFSPGQSRIGCTRSGL